MRLCDAETMRSLDHQSIHAFGIPGVVLMENAGRGTFELIKARFSELLSSGVTVLCGRGNNGGDGFVIARHLANAGVKVTVLLFAPFSSVSGDAAINLAIARQMAIPVLEVIDVAAWQAHREEALSPRLVVDALLGTGLNTEVRGLLLNVIEDLNRAARCVVAVDIPSGLHADTGRAMGAAVVATLTATYGLAKRGLLLETSFPYVGELKVVDISIPASLLAWQPGQDRLLEATDVAETLPLRAREGHKGIFGHLEVIAGSVGKVGAAVLACHAALRSGVGLVSLALPRSAVPFLGSLRPEVMLDLLEDDGSGHLMPSSLSALAEALEHRDAVALGPGLSTAPGVGEVLEVLLEVSPLPMVIDADGLNILSRRPSLIAQLRPNIVLTPHPGEASRLLGVHPVDIQRDRLEAVKSLARKTGAIAVLKGSRTLICGPSGGVSMNATGNAGMGTAGSGDVLTGLLGGLLAQRMAAEEAACAAVYLHGLAGDLAAAVTGQRALIAGDLISHLGDAFRVLLGEQA